MFHPRNSRPFQRFFFHVFLCAALGGAAPFIFEGRAWADSMAEGYKPVTSTFELSNINEYPNHLFVVFPYTACFGFNDQFFEMNPHLDVPGPSYHVMVAGEPLERYKHCNQSQLYAFEKTGFTIDKRTLESHLDFYRGPGRVLVRIKEFEDLKISEKIKFLGSDKRVKKANIDLQFPLAISQEIPVAKTHDLLRIAELSQDAFRAYGDKLIATMIDGTSKSMNYEGGKRPELENLMKNGGPAPQASSSASAQSPASKASNAKASLSSDSATSTYVAGASAAVLAGLVILAVMSKGDRKKRRPKA